MVEIYAVNIRQFPSRYLAELPPMDKKRTETFYRLKCKDDKTRCVVCGMLINKYVLCKEKNQQIEYSTHHKPFVKGGKEFNLSHSGDYVLLAVGDCSVGIDIEKHSSIDFINIARFICTEEELSALKQSSTLQTDFYKYWTLKESYMKATGKGFSMSPKSFAFDLTNNLKINIDTEFEFSQINFSKDYTVSVCAKEKVNTNINFVSF